MGECFHKTNFPCCPSCLFVVGDCVSLFTMVNSYLGCMFVSRRIASMWASLLQSNEAQVIKIRRNLLNRFFVAQPHTL